MHYTETDRIRAEAKQHRAAAKALRAMIRTEEARPLGSRDPVYVLRLRSSLSVRTSLARSCDRAIEASRAVEASLAAARAAR